MKRFLQLFLLIVLVAGFATEAGAAKKRTRVRTSAATPTVTVGETKQYGDALTTRVYSIKKGESKISVEYPVEGNPEIVKLLRRYIVECIDSNNASTYADMATPDALLKATIRGYKKKLSFGAEGETIDQTVSISFANDKVVTVRNVGYIYSGGAHGMPWDLSATFLISDGTQLSQKMLPSFATLKPYVLEGLAQYVDCQVYQLGDWGFSVDDLDYPGADSPYIDEKGFNLIYGPYEIGPYSIGMPVAVIPLDVMKNLCSGEALKFF